MERGRREREDKAAPTVDDRGDDKGDDDREMEVDNWQADFGTQNRQRALSEGVKIPRDRWEGFR